MEHVSIWGTPFPAILNQKDSTGSAGGAKNSQNWGILVPPKIWLKQIYRDMKFILRGLPGQCVTVDEPQAEELRETRFYPHYCFGIAIYTIVGPWQH